MLHVQEAWPDHLSRWQAGVNFLLCTSCLRRVQKADAPVGKLLGAFLVMGQQAPMQG